MSASGLMSIGIRAMFANQAALQTTGHNIANANVAGYSRQSVELATAQGQFTGAGFFGKGVDVQTVNRAYNTFLTEQAASSKSVSSADQARLDQLQLLEKVFPTGDAGLGAAANRFLDAWGDVSLNPADPSARQVLMSRAGEFAVQMQTAGGQLDVLQAGLTQDLQMSVKSLNEMTSRLADVNKQIVEAVGQGHAPNDLLDERDRLVSQISGIVNVTTIPSEDGSLGVFLGGGQRLVLGSQATQLAVVPDAQDPSRAAIGIVDTTATRLLPSTLIGGGSIAGMLRFQDQDLVAARNSLGQMATAIAGAVNLQQSLGSSQLRDPATGLPQAGADLFRVPGPQALANTNNARAADGSFLGAVQVDFSGDWSALQASDYQLQWNPDPAATAADRYIVTRLSDGQVTKISDSGGTLDGMTISFPPPGPPQQGDSFLLQPVGRAAAGMRKVLDDPKGLAAASPITAVAGLSNTGSASVASVRAVGTLPDPTLATNIAFTSGSGDFQWQQVDMAGNVVASGNGTWVPGADISINGFALALNGVPKAGDTFSVAGMPGMSAAVGAGNTGIGAVSVGTGGGTSDPTLTAQVSFTSAAGDYTWQLVDAAGQVTSSGAGTLPAGQPLQINGLSLTLTGSPQPGDTLTARRATYTPNNNGNALLMVGLREQGFIDGKTPSEAYGAAMGDVGVRVQGAETSAKISGAVAAEAQERVNSVTGVNLDEEAARLMQFQQSYQAAAKVLQVAQSVFETLLQTAGN